MIGDLLGFGIDDTGLVLEIGIWFGEWDLGLGFEDLDRGLGLEIGKWD